MSFHVVRFEDVVPQPWKNGGGVTRELLAWPDVNNWVMRLSVADIERDGSFSAFPGIDRWFAVLTGKGVRLGESRQMIVAGDPPLHFDGASAPACSLIVGATRDLNLMVRRVAAKGWMTQVTPGMVWPSADATQSAVADAVAVRGVFSLTGCDVQLSREKVVNVPAMSMAWTSDATLDDSWPISVQESDRATFAFGCVMRRKQEHVDA